MSFGNVFILMEEASRKRYRYWRKRAVALTEKITGEKNKEDPGQIFVWGGDTPLYLASRWLDHWERNIPAAMRRLFT